MYVQDNNGLFSDEQKFVDRELYLDDKLLLCPAATKPAEQGGQNPFASYNGSSYVSNGHCRSKSVFALQKPDMIWKSPDMKNASEVPMFLDNSYGAGCKYSFSISSLTTDI